MIFTFSLLIMHSREKVKKRRYSYRSASAGKMREAECEG
jgi:hypothetical protein